MSFRQKYKEAILSSQVSLEIGYTYLVLCEGERTEVNYFTELIDKAKIKGVKVEGVGMQGKRLLEEALKAKKREDANRYDLLKQIWIVFDKDDTTDFNIVINDAKKHKIQCAWCNEAFELWYVFHLDDAEQKIQNALNEAPRPRDAYEKVLSDAVKNADREQYFPEMTANNHQNYTYGKTDNNYRTYCITLGNVENAIETAKLVYKKYSSLKKKIPPSQMLHCTTVYQLIEELRKP